MTDPSACPEAATTAALLREVTRLERRIDEGLAGVTGQQVHEHNLLQEQLDGRFGGLRDLHDTDIENLRQLSATQDAIRDERLRTVEVRFELIEKQRLELKEDSQKALDTALQGAGANLANLAETYNTGHTALTSSIDEVKNRLTAVEAKAAGGRETSTSTMALLGLGLTLMLIATTIVVNLFVHH